MAAPTYTVTDTTPALASAGTAAVTITIQKDGSAVNLAGTTPRCNIRRDVNRPTDHALLDEVALTITNAASGICRLDLTDAMLKRMGQEATRPEELIPYIVQVYIQSLSYYPDAFRVWVRATAS